MTFADEVLDWVLRHGKSAANPDDHDLVLVGDHPALQDPSPAAQLSGKTWRVRRVTGEVTLRDALLEAGRLVAVVPTGFVAPLDLTGRAWLGRQVRVRPRDLVAALTRRPCEPITDDALARGVEAALPRLLALKDGWSVGGTVGQREIRNMLLGLQVGAVQRFDREAPEALLERWIVDGPPEVTTAGLLAEALRQEHGKVGEALAWAVTEGTLEALVAAGALAGSGEGASLAPPVPGITGAADRHRLRSVVEQAVRAAWAKNPTRARRALDEAERRAARLGDAHAPVHPLLSGPLERHLVEAARKAAAGEPENDDRLEALSTNLHLSAHLPTVELVRDLSRLARFVGEPRQDLAGWAALARSDVAWADLAFRRARQRLADAGPRLAPLARLVLNEVAARRDALNAAFGKWLAAEWPRVAGQTDVRGPFALQHVSRLLLRPLLDAGQRVLLVVLDGCDLASFVDLVEQATDHDVALGLPDVSDPDLRADLAAGGPWRVAVAPLPTVTSHARRALFAGELPRSTALDATEEAAANASHDKRAFQGNPALGGVARTLLLKGDVGDLGQAVHDALQGRDRLVAVVLNDVDDALGSKETTPMRPWSLGSLGANALGWLKEALQAGWCVVVTADHGHTPYVASDRKLAIDGDGPRIARGPGPGVVTFDRGPLPTTPLFLLTGFGAWRGTQHRGWHGGAGLEEVFVPLAVLRPGREHHDAFSPPPWWTRTAVEVEAEVLPEPGVLDAVTPVGWLARIADEADRRVLAHLDRHGSITERDLSELVGGSRAARRFAGRVEALAVLTPFRVRVEPLPDGSKRYAAVRE